MQKFKNAFTLVELMIVVVLLGMIAAFGIPNYSKSHDRVNEKTGQYNLSVIDSAMEMYRIRNAGYPDPGGLPDPTVTISNISEINAALSLGIIEQNMTYACTDDDDNTTFSCTAAEGGWTLSITQADDGIVCCLGGANLCPTIADC